METDEEVSESERRWPWHWKATLWSYRTMARRRMPMLGLVILFLFWGYGIFQGYADQEPEPYGETWSLMRQADLEISLARELEGSPEALEVFLARDTDVPVWDEWNGYFQDAEENGLLTEEGKKVANEIAALAKGEAEEVDIQGWETTWENEGLYSWEIEILRQRYASDRPAWVEDALASAEEVGQVNLERAIFAEGIWAALALIGLPFLPSALRCFRQKNHQPLRPLAGGWTLSWLLGAYLISDLVGDGFWHFVNRATALWEDYPYPMMIGSDSLWRLASPAVVVILLFSRWRHAWRVSGLDLFPKMKPVLGMLPIAYAYNFIIYWGWEKVGFDYGLEFLDNWESGYAGLFYSVLSGVVLAPFVEEIVYRGFLFEKTIPRFGFWGAMIFSTIFFALIHFYDIPGSLSVAFFGFAACALYRGTGSLWSGIIYHAIVNGAITAGYWPYYYGGY